ncbi:hypothetical protein XaC1_123 [Xanthomonas phage XaC1]|nr:hypothetical protein XaC1_123 [Xanthomonas phage XaC1]
MNSLKKIWYSTNFRVFVLLIPTYFIFLFPILYYTIPYVYIGLVLQVVYIGLIILAWKYNNDE